MPDLAKTGVAGANGLITLVFQPTSRQDWTVKQVSVNGAMDGAVQVGSGAQCNVFLDTSFIATLAVPKDVASGAPYVDLNNGRNLYVRITGAVVGSVAQAVILYDEVVQPVG